MPDAPCLRDERALNCGLDRITLATASFLRDPVPGMYDVGEVVHACSDFFYHAHSAGWTLARALTAVSGATLRAVSQAGIGSDDTRCQWLQSQVPHWALGYFT